MKKIDKELAKLGPRSKFERKNRVAEFYRLTKEGWVRELYGWSYEKGKVTSFLVGRQKEGGKLMTRNIEFVFGAGYFVRMPGERPTTRRYYGYGNPYGVWRWVETESFNMGCIYRMWDIGEMREKDAKIRYLKVNDEAKLMDDISIIKRYPQSESLFTMGLDRLARQKRMYHLSKDMTKCVIGMIRKDHEAIKGNQNLNMIIHCITEGITMSECRSRAESKRNRISEYLRNQGCSKDIYSDYIAMCRINRIDLSEEMNRFPRDLRKSHDALVDLRNKADKEKWDRKIRKALKNSWMEASIGQYTFRLPTCFDDFRDQATELGNCLINNEYYKKHAEGKDIIVFVLIGDRRVGTIEVREGSPSLHQFTGNQKHQSWKPDPMLAKAGEEWRENIWKPRCRSNQSMTS